MPFKWKSPNPKIGSLLTPEASPLSFFDAVNLIYSGTWTMIRKQDGTYKPISPTWAMNWTLGTIQRLTRTRVLYAALRRAEPVSAADCGSSEATRLAVEHEQCAMKAEPQ